MSLIERLTFLFFGLVLIGWLYWLTGKVLLLFTYAEQLLGTSAHLLGAVPGRSAERTAAADDEQPRPWFPVLRALTALRDRFDELTTPVLLEEDDGHDDDVEPDAPSEEDLELHRWADDGGPVPDDQPEPAAPATEPLPRIDIAGGLRLRSGRHAQQGTPRPATVAPDADETDLALVRFSFAEGHTR